MISDACMVTNFFFFKVYVQKLWRNGMSDMSEGGERLDQAMVVSPPRIDPIKGMAPFEEDAPPNGIWM